MAIHVSHFKQCNGQANQVLFNHFSALKQNEFLVISDLAKRFPSSLTQIKKITGIDNKMFLVCCKCHSIYENISQCMEKESSIAI